MQDRNRWIKKFLKACKAYEGTENFQFNDTWLWDGAQISNGIWRVTKRYASVRMTKTDRVSIFAYTPPLHKNPKRTVTYLTPGIVDHGHRDYESAARFVVEHLV